MSVNGTEVVGMGYPVFRRMLALIQEMEDRLKEGEKFDFPYLIRGDISDAHRLGFRPITFFRQVTSMCLFPELSLDMPEDVVQRANELLDIHPERSLGTMIYQGNPVIRQHVADYISQRDFVEAKAANIWLTSGVLHGVSIFLQVIKRRFNGKQPGVVTCVPQYMAYSTMLQDIGYYQANDWFHGTSPYFFVGDNAQACYYLDEDRGWTHNTSEMQKAVDASKKFCVPRCFLLVNPANPPSTVLSMQQIQEIIKFAYKNQLIILVDEIFEHNTYSNKLPFCSVRKAMNAMEAPYTRTQLVSFSSLSKGFVAEAGIQSGYFEAVNLDAVDQTNLEHAMAEALPSTVGQIALDCLVKPPCPGDASYEVYSKEKACILNSMAERAKLAENRLNAIDGIHCSPVQGSMAAYPRIFIPDKAIEEAQRQNKEPDLFYAEELLKKKGVSIMPSCAFGRIPGRFHMRITILPPKDKLMELFNRLESFQKELMAQYA